MNLQTKVVFQTVIYFGRFFSELERKVFLNGQKHLLNKSCSESCYRGYMYMYS